MQAVGLFVIGAGNNFAGDYTLSVAQGGVSNSFNTDSTFGTLADGGTVYFLGLIETDPGQSFASAVLSSVSEGGFPFNVDDIVTSAGAGSGEPRTVPDESSTFVLLLGVAVGLLALRRRWS